MRTQSLSTSMQLRLQESTAKLNSLLNHFDEETRIRNSTEKPRDSNIIYYKA